MEAPLYPQRSPYLVDALQSTSTPSQPAPPAFTVTPEQLQKLTADRKAWQTANPGGNYLAHAVKQAGGNLMAAPGNMLSGLQGAGTTLASIPGQLAGLFGLGRAAGVP